jgi:hypothetical protein
LIICPDYSTLVGIIESLRWIGILMVAAFREQRDQALENPALFKYYMLLNRSRIENALEGGYRSVSK